MITMAVIVFLALTAIAAAHVAWGLGMNWPVADRDELFHLVVGASGRSEFPGLLQCFAAAGAIFVSALAALIVAGIVQPPIPSAWVTTLGVMMAVVFTARGLAPYTQAWRRRFSKQPFAWMDRNCYGPFILTVAVVFGLLTLNRVVVLS
jgi:hypothetical protein